MKRHKAGIYFISVGTIFILLSVIILANNCINSRIAGKASDDVLQSMERHYADLNSVEEPIDLPVGSFRIDEVSYEMKTIEINGNEYIGYISIPALDLELPVMTDWNYDKLRIAPCRQFGTLLGRDLIVAAHNHQEHFGRLKNLEYGDVLYFTDVEGYTFSYCVSSIETIQPYQLDEMLAGDWDLTLYTCTYRGESRLTVRFVRT